MLKHSYAVTVVGCMLFLAPLLVYAQTVSELQAELNALLQQLAALKAELQQAQSPAVNAPTVPSYSAYGKCLSLGRSLRRGMSGSDVAALQTFLAPDARIYPEGVISGYFGALTEAAVKRFQARHAIVTSGTPDTTGYGVVGPATRAAIASLCGGSSSQAQAPTYAGANCIFTGGQVASGVVQTFYAVPSAPLGSSCASYAQARQCINGAFSGDPRYQYVSCTNPGRACTLDGVTVPHESSYAFFSRREVLLNESCTPYAQTRVCNDGVLSGSSGYQYATCAASTTPSGCTLDGVTVQHGQSRTFYKEKNVLFGQTCTPFGKERSCSNGTLGGDVSYQYSSCTVAAPQSCTVGTTTIAHGQAKDFYSRASVSYQESCAAYKQSRTCTDGLISGSPSYQFSTCTQIPAKTCALDGIEVAHGASYTFYKAGVSSNCGSISKSRTCTDGVLSDSADYRYGQCAPVGQRWCKLDGVYIQHNASRTFYTASTTPFGQSCANLGQSRTCVDGVMQGNISYAYASCMTAAPASCTLDGETVAHNQSYGFYSRQSAPPGDTCDAYKQVRTCFDGSLTGSTSFIYRTCSNSSASLLQQTNLASALAALEHVLQSLLAQGDSLF